jgi:hypothetical protein
MDFMYPVRNERCTPASVAPNARCLEGLLLVFDSGYSSVSILVADDHLPGMLPACKQLYFLEHLQDYNWWCSGRSTPTVMLSCWLWIDCLLNAWNQMTDQFNKLLSNVTCSSCFESSWNPILELRSRTCCCSGPRTILNDFLQIFFALAGLNLPLCAKFLRYYAYVFFRKIAAWCWNLIATSQRFICQCLYFFLVLKTDEFQLLFQMMHDFRVLHSHL